MALTDEPWGGYGRGMVRLLLVVVACGLVSFGLIQGWLWLSAFGSPIPMQKGATSSVDVGAESDPAPTPYPALERTNAHAADWAPERGDAAENPEPPPDRQSSVHELRRRAARGEGQLPPPSLLPTDNLDKGLFMDQGIDRYLRGLESYSYSTLAKKSWDRVSPGASREERDRIAQAINSLCDADYSFRAEIMDGVKQALMTDRLLPLDNDGKNDAATPELVSGQISASIQRPDMSPPVQMGIKYSLRVAEYPRILGAKMARQAAVEQFELLLRSTHSK